MFEKFNKLSPEQEEKMILVASEAVELAQAINKALLHGLESRNPATSTTKLEDIIREYADLLAAYDELNNCIVHDLKKNVPVLVDQKKLKIPLYLHEVPGQILGVAIKIGNTDKTYQLPRPYRHHDVISRICRNHGCNTLIEVYNRYGCDSLDPKDQGFYTSKGRFVSREEGLKIARAAGQVNEIISCTCAFSFKRLFW